MIKLARPKQNKPWRKRQIRFSLLEDALLELMDKTKDAESKELLRKKLLELREHQIEKIKASV